MSRVSRIFARAPRRAGPRPIPVLSLLVALAAWPALSKGIVVRFLPNPPEDSVVNYQVLRADGPGLAPVPVGQVAAAAGRDTFAFADTSAVKGRPYLYSIVGLDAGGGASDPSDSTAVAQPSLALPDTLKGGALGARFTLAGAADPLSGAAPLALSLEDSSRFTLRYDSAAKQIVLAPRGEARSGQVIVRATYFGKFTDRGTVWLSLEPAALVPGSGSAARARAWSLPAAWSLRSGALRIRGPGREDGPGAGSGTAAPAAHWSLWTARGEAVAVLALPGDGSDASWDGRDQSGLPAVPAGYLWTARAADGALLRSGSLRILP